MSCWRRSNCPGSVMLASSRDVSTALHDPTLASSCASDELSALSSQLLSQGDPPSPWLGAGLSLQWFQDGREPRVRKNHQLPEISFSYRFGTVQDVRRFDVLILVATALDPQAAQAEKTMSQLIGSQHFPTTLQIPFKTPQIPSNRVHGPALGFVTSWVCTLPV